MCCAYAREIQAWACEQERRRRDGFLHDWALGLRAEDDGAEAGEADPFAQGVRPVQPPGPAVDSPGPGKAFY